ncbi:DUF2336 domain-containing protein [Terrihabitans soli]|uniref:DUF2336 domain-containing protein n=1 Tax=Terrihabitans soli TaxID=708113 RepID=UPI001CA354B7|nr:DUF2336 domain-containing protein [Terrihabitans soli]
MTDSNFRLLGLQRLVSEHGLDVQATVLRVATDLFCQSRTHAPADIARYTDLALALLDQVDAATRNAVADKLSRLPNAPEKVLKRLLDDNDIAVSSAVLAHSPALKLENLTAFLAQCGAGEAAAVARRTDIDADTVRTLTGHASILVTEALLENHALSFDASSAALLIARAAKEPSLTKIIFGHPGFHAADFAPLYPRAPDAVRTDIRLALAERAPRVMPPVLFEAVSALNEAVTALDRERIAAALVKALRLDPAGIGRVLEDETGEVFVMALAAAGIKRPLAINLLLVLAPKSVRLSVERIFAAADIHETTSRRVAREIVSAVAGERRTGTQASFEPFMHPSGTPMRSGAARRALTKPQQATRRPDIIGKA